MISDRSLIQLTTPISAYPVNNIDFINLPTENEFDEICVYWKIAPSGNLCIGNIPL